MTTITPKTLLLALLPTKGSQSPLVDVHMCRRFEYGVFRSLTTTHFSPLCLGVQQMLLSPWDTPHPHHSLRELSLNLGQELLSFLVHSVSAVRELSRHGSPPISWAPPPACELADSYDSFTHREGPRHLHVNPTGPPPHQPLRVTMLGMSGISECLPGQHLGYERFCHKHVPCRTNVP